MTDLERFFRHLVRTLTATDPGRLRQPLAVADIRGTIIPYRYHRRALQIDSSEDYEMALVQLCAGEGDFATSSPEEARTRFETEATSPNPELGVVRQFGEALVMLTPVRIAEVVAEIEAEAAARAADPGKNAGDVAGDVIDGDTDALETSGHGTTSRETIDAEADGDTLVDAVFAASAPPADAAPTSSAPSQPPLPTASPDGERATPDPLGDVALPNAVHCVACAEMLPLDRPAKFCPYCGTSQTSRQCVACGADLDPGWRFCAVCGQGT